MHERALFTPIRWRLVAWTLLIVGLILALLGTSIYFTLAKSLTDQVDRNLAGQSDPYQVFPVLFGGRSGEPHTPREGYHGGVFYLAIDANGQVSANPQQVDLSDVTWPRAATQDRAIVFGTVTLNDEATRVAVRSTPDGGTLVVGQSLAAEQAALKSLLIILVGGGAIGLLLTVGGAWFLAGRALLPIQQAFRRQQEFVADASHELRTPLTVLRSATDILDRHRAEPLGEQAELFEDVQAEIRRMERLVQDLLTVARSDRGELQLMTAEVDLSRVASDVVRRMRPLAEARQVQLSSVEASALVEVDPERIQQVAVILLDNAIKYTPAGGHIAVRAGQDGHMAVLEVADSGPGIAAEHLPRIFDRFYRADKARSRAAGGTGLGLTIAKLLVDAHGGELTLSSEPGSGTVATLRLPLNGDRPVAFTDGLRKLQGSISKVIA